MKRLLHVSIGFTLLTPPVHADQSYKLTNVKCESESQAKIGPLGMDSTNNYLELSMDSKTLKLDSQSYEIVPLGLPDPGSKYVQVYRAFPNSQGSANQSLFIEMSEDEKMILVRRLDDDLSSCGGGFINFEFTAN